MTLIIFSILFGVTASTRSAVGTVTAGIAALREDMVGTRAEIGTIRDGIGTAREDRCLVERLPPAPSRQAAGQGLTSAWRCRARRAALRPVTHRASRPGRFGPCGVSEWPMTDQARQGLGS
ncbi:MAG TPA: hypothetical protein VMQ51_07135 [Candidatus Binatia bacterium]|nr:hypothetical protein [Candidatus Binatia bacterium]